MNDKELLELAAKAAGIEVYWCESNSCYWLADESDSFVPIDNDGDALRLAVKLGINLEWRNDGRVAAYRHANANGHCFTAFESSREERDAATRRAIVRAAAEIGRQA